MWRKLGRIICPEKFDFDWITSHAMDKTLESGALHHVNIRIMKILEIALNVVITEIFFFNRYPFVWPLVEQPDVGDWPLWNAGDVCQDIDCSSGCGSGSSQSV